MARDLQRVMAYTRWEKFEVPLNRAMKAAQNTGADVTSNFHRSVKITGTRSGVDYRLSRYAAYLVAMNGDPNKGEVAQAQTYFAVKTREAEVGATRPTSELDLIIAAAQEMKRMRDALEATTAAAIEATEDARMANARIDAIEGRHDWFSALGYAKTYGLRTDSVSLARLGKLAATMGRTESVEPNKVQHAHYGAVNEFPLHIWQRAAAALGGAA